MHSFDRISLRVLILTSTFPRWIGDTEPPFVFELCKRLAQHFDVRVVAPHTPGASRHETIGGIEVFRYRYAPDWLEQIAYEGGILARLRLRKWRYLLLPFFFLSQWLSIQRQLASWRPDLIDAHWLMPQGFLAALPPKWSGTPLVCTSHGGDLYALRGKLMRRVNRWTMNRCDALVVVSQAMAEHIDRIYAPIVRPTVISMGIDASRVFTPASNPQRADNEILFVGRLVEKKGLSHLIEAMPTVLRQRPDVRLTIVGTGPEETATRNLAERLGVSAAVRFEGAVLNADLTEYYRRATLLAAPFVVASNGDQDSVGLVCAEALACGCPVIATDIGLGAVVVDGITGRLSKTADSADLAEKILEMLDQPHDRRRLSASGRTHVLENFDWARVTERYCELYRDTAASSAPRSKHRCAR